MNKGEFVNYLAKKHSCTKVDTEKTIDMFTASTIDTIDADSEISLISFDNFSVSKKLPPNTQITTI